MKKQLITATVFVLVIGLTATAQRARVVNTQTARINAGAALGPCEGQEPRGDRIGPRDRTRGENPPRDGRGIGRGYRHGPRNGLGVGAARGNGWGQGLRLRDGSGIGRGQGFGLRDGSGLGRGQGWGGGPRDGTGPNCPQAN
jgi:hypothetical protein